MNRLFRYSFVAIVLLAGFLAMNYLQHRYDEADLNKAVAAVRESHPFGPNQSNMEQMLARRYELPSDAIEWESALESKWRGTVRVTARIPGQDRDVVWRVDLVRQAVTPLSNDVKSLEYWNN